MIDDIQSDAEERMEKSLEALGQNFNKIRTGRAHPSILDGIRIDYYGAETPLNQLASVTAPSASQLVVDVYDKNGLGDVERALVESDIGMSPNNDGKVIRLNVPQLTTERRAELAKTAKGLGEDGKVALRNIRRDAVDKIKKLKGAGLGEDEVRDREDEVQKAVKKYEKEVETIISAKEKEITTV